MCDEVICLVDVAEHVIRSAIEKIADRLVGRRCHRKLDQDDQAIEQERLQSAINHNTYQLRVKAKVFFRRKMIKRMNGM